MDIHDRLKRVFDHCYEHMSGTAEDDYKALKALTHVYEDTGKKPEIAREALLYHKLLELINEERRGQYQN